MIYAAHAPLSFILLRGISEAVGINLSLYYSTLSYELTRGEPYTAKSI